MAYNSDLITLVPQITQSDPINGDSVIDDLSHKRQIYADVFTAGRDEFNAAGVNGIKASYTFRIYSFEYAGETIALYQGKRYFIYRTSGVGDKLNLFVEEKVGKK
ncbi:hypothetical protein ACKP2L_05080 [Oenococcus alcoholitolerans]|uniref:hypothetical protein n=1 Tax=Oenococcus alcoholitolerans TaxID=931074 RepID=UPI003F6F1E98